MKNITPFYIEVNLEDYDKIDTPDDLLFAKLNTDGSENIIDKGLKRLIKYIYDDKDRCIEKVIYKRTFDLTFELEDDTEMLYQYDSTVTNNYLPDSPYPFRTKHKEFWVAYTYDKESKLKYAVNSKGSTLEMAYHEDGSLYEKTFTIKKEDKNKQYIFRFDANKKRYFYEYEDSDGNFWNNELGFDCPFYSPITIMTMFNNNKDFI